VPAVRSEQLAVPLVLEIRAHTTAVQLIEQGLLNIERHTTGSFWIEGILKVASWGVAMVEDEME